jgi:predicted esterase
MLLPLGFVLLWASRGVAGEAMRPGDYHKMIISSADGTTQPYRLFIPEGYSGEQPMPLLVVLHGKWVNENTWFEVTRVKEYAQRRGYIVASPYARGSESYRGKAQQDVLDTIAEVRRLCAIDENRIYLLGHSMGGWGAWFVGLSHPDLFASICAMSGWAPEDLLPNALHLDPLIVHGDHDEIVSVEHSRAAERALASLGIPHYYWERGGYRHLDNMINECLWAAFDWLDQKRRIERPFVVSLRTRTPVYGRAYWIEIVKTTRFPRLASLDAQIIESRHLKMTTSNVSQFIVDPARAPLTSKGAVEMECDSQRLGAHSPDPAAVWLFSKDTPHDNWVVAAVPRSSAPRYCSPVVANLSEPVENSPKISGLGEKVADILREQTGADVALLTDDMLTTRLVRGKLLADDLLSIYHYPEERLAEFTASGAELLRAITLTGAQKEWWGDVQFSGLQATLQKADGEKLRVVSSTLEPAKLYRVVCPAVMTATLAPSPSILNVTIPDCLYEYARKGGSFAHRCDGRKRLLD